MLSDKPWEPEAVLALLGGVIAAFFFGNIAVAVLQHAGVAGFQGEVGIGTILLSTLSFHGVVLILGTIFLKFHDQGWRDVFGGANWKRCLGLAVVVLALGAPVILGLKAVSELALRAMHYDVEDQMAVTMILTAKPWVCAYLVFFAVVLAPLAEEFFFRGILFTTAKRYGWRKLGWFGVSFLFALMHANIPTLLPLFVFALALTWLYEKTGGLLAPVLAHSLFNTANLVLLLLAEKYHLIKS